MRRGEGRKSEEGGKEGVRRRGGRVRRGKREGRQEGKERWR